MVATYVVAPLPNAVCSKCTSDGEYGIVEESGWIDFGRFLTGFLVVMGMGRCISGGGRSWENKLADYLLFCVRQLYQSCYGTAI